MLYFDNLNMVHTFLEYFLIPNGPTMFNRIPVKRHTWLWEPIGYVILVSFLLNVIVFQHLCKGYRFLQITSKNIVKNLACRMATFFWVNIPNEFQVFWINEYFLAMISHIIAKNLPCLLTGCRYFKQNSCLINNQVFVYFRKWANEDLSEKMIVC